MKKLFVLSVFILSLPNLAGAGVLCNGKTTHALEECAQSNFKLSDDQLNVFYKDFSSKLSRDQKALLVDAQREWIKYKESTCQAAYDATSPGEEAGIDKWTCLDEVTRARINELHYLDSGIGGDSFLHAVDVVAKLYEGGNRDRFIEKLSKQPASKDDQHWGAYVSKNCILAVQRLHEERNLCVARQNFYSYPLRCGHGPAICPTCDVMARSWAQSISPPITSSREMCGEMI
ncbi:DUF1311 domain-containing protein [Dyella sp. M7H15-1]|uniref:lysozyme inhibitor LprI family protein n=1 Tax=Dyella sp. M7H15-1 TaxID=2501295 RepID=UPI00100505F1|nr:lysozyme inhibitor LprI family protein [Dyella sp. M7H15-1]QAU24625.1 DUF1311 domain-containing protein [Dyella sp. M7H15-1]